MDFSHQRRVAPSSKSDGNQQLFKLYSPPPQGYAPLSSIRGRVPLFLLSDDHNLQQESDSYQRNMSNRPQSLGDARTSQQLPCSFQPFNYSAGIAQHSANDQQASQLTDDQGYLEFVKYHFGIPNIFDLNNVPDFNTSEIYPAWDTFNQRATPKTIAPSLLDARHPHVGFEFAPAGLNQPLHYPKIGPTTPTFTDNALPITAGNTKRRKVEVSFDSGPTQTPTANFTASQQRPLSSTEPVVTVSHDSNRTHHGPPYSPGSMPTAEPDFNETQHWDVRRKTRMQKTGHNFTASQQRPADSMHPTINTPSPSHGQASKYSSPAYSVSPSFQYQHPAVNHNVHQNIWNAPPSGQQGVGLPSASMLPAQPTFHALMPFNQHDNDPAPSTNPGQDFSSYSQASSPPFNTQQPAADDFFEQYVWSSPPPSPHGAELPTSSLTAAQLTSPDFLQDNQQGNNLSNGPQVNVYQQNNILSSGVQVNQPSNVFSSGAQVNQQNSVLSSGPQVNQQGVGVPPANIASTQPASFISPHVNQQGNALPSGPPVNQQNVGIASANMPPAQTATATLPQINQQGNAQASGPQANQQNAVPLNGQPITIPRNVIRTNTGAYRSDGHNADMKFLQAIPAKAALPAMKLSLTELLTYFPNHLTWPYVMLRFVAAGAPAKGAPMKRVAQGQLFVRGVVNDQDATESINAKIRQQRREAGRMLLGRTTYTAQAAENQLKTLSAGRVSYDVSAYAARPYHQPTVHTKLVDIARGVRLHPAGQDAGIFTQVVQHVLGNLTTLADKTTADVMALANEPQLAFNHPAEAGTDDWDKNCLENIIQLLKAHGMP